MTASSNGRIDPASLAKMLKRDVDKFNDYKTQLDKVQPHQLVEFFESTPVLGQYLTCNQALEFFRHLAPGYVIRVDRLAALWQYGRYRFKPVRFVNGKAEVDAVAEPKSKADPQPPIIPNYQDYIDFYQTVIEAFDEPMINQQDLLEFYNWATRKFGSQFWRGQCCYIYGLPDLNVNEAIETPELFSPDGPRTFVFEQCTFSEKMVSHWLKALAERKEPSKNKITICFHNAKLDDGFIEMFAELLKVAKRCHIVFTGTINTLGSMQKPTPGDCYAVECEWIAASVNRYGRYEAVRDFSKAALDKESSEWKKRHNILKTTEDILPDLVEENFTAARKFIQVFKSNPNTANLAGLSFNVDMSQLHHQQLVSAIVSSNAVLRPLTVCDTPENNEKTNSHQESKSEETAGGKQGYWQRLAYLSEIFSPKLLLESEHITPEMLKQVAADDKYPIDSRSMQLFEQFYYGRDDSRLPDDLSGVLFTIIEYYHFHSYLSTGLLPYTETIASYDGFWKTLRERICRSQLFGQLSADAHWQFHVKNALFLAEVLKYYILFVFSQYLDMPVSRLMRLDPDDVKNSCEYNFLKNIIRANAISLEDINLALSKFFSEYSGLTNLFYRNFGNEETVSLPGKPSKIIPSKKVMMIKRLSHLRDKIIPDVRKQYMQETSEYHKLQLTNLYKSMKMHTEKEQFVEATQLVEKQAAIKIRAAIKQLFELHNKLHQLSTAGVGVRESNTRKRLIKNELYQFVTSNDSISLDDIIKQIKQYGRLGDDGVYHYLSHAEKAKNEIFRINDANLQFVNQLSSEIKDVHNLLVNPYKDLQTLIVGPYKDALNRASQNVKDKQKNLADITKQSKTATMFSHKEKYTDYVECGRELGFTCKCGSSCGEQTGYKDVYVADEEKRAEYAEKIPAAKISLEAANKAERAARKELEKYEAYMQKFQLAIHADFLLCELNILYCSFDGVVVTVFDKDKVKQAINIEVLVERLAELKNQLLLLLEAEDVNAISKIFDKFAQQQCQKLLDALTKLGQKQLTKKLELAELAEDFSTYSPTKVSKQLEEVVPPHRVREAEPTAPVVVEIISGSRAQVEKEYQVVKDATSCSQDLGDAEPIQSTEPVGNGKGEVTEPGEPVLYTKQYDPSAPYFVDEAADAGEGPLLPSDSCTDNGGEGALPMDIDDEMPVLASDAPPAYNPEILEAASVPPAYNPEVLEAASVPSENNPAAVSAAGARPPYNPALTMHFVAPIRPRDGANADQISNTEATTGAALANLPSAPALDPEPSYVPDVSASSSCEASFAM